MEYREFVEQAAHVKPNKIQLDMLRKTPFYMFAHFGTNTYTGLEWGDGTADPLLFNPTELDCDQWCEVAKSAGMKGIVLTAKHHDGFCLWQSEYTDYCMKSSPYKGGKGDIVAECSDACRRHGLKFGVYLSPWDRNSKYYGSDEYNVYYKNQLTELMTKYGKIFYVWFDGACGEGPNGIKQIYDFPGYIDIIKKYQPDAAIFNDRGIIRWCGNEAGEAQFTSWAVMPSELCDMPEIQTGPGPGTEDLSYLYNTAPDLGMMHQIVNSKGLVFSPSEVDMSIRPGWFWHEEEEPHSLEKLLLSYINSVGNNSTFHLNVPPTVTGKIDERDVKRLKEFGELLEEKFGTNLAQDGTITKEDGLSDTQPRYVIRMPEKRGIHYVEIAERIAEGQRVEGFSVLERADDGALYDKYSGTTIGSRKIVDIGCVHTNEIVIRINSSRTKPDIEYIRLH